MRSKHSQNLSIVLCYKKKPNVLSRFQKPRKANEKFSTVFIINLNPLFVPMRFVKIIMTNFGVAAAMFFIRR